MKNYKYVYSNSQEEMVIYGFTLIYREDMKYHYTWNDECEMYISDECEEDAFFCVPKTSKRYKVEIDEE